MTLLCAAPQATLGAPTAASASVSKKSKKRTTKRKRRNRKRTGAKTRAYTVKNLLNTPDSATWVRKGKSEIVICKDSTGTVRAMTPYTVNPEGARRYAEAVNEYSRLLEGDGVKVYSLLVPSQGEYYMPAITSTAGAEKRTIELVAGYMDPKAVTVQINDTMANHLDEPIYSRTDHHWAPLGAYYGSKAFAEAAGVPFRPLTDYTPRVVKDYVGTMPKFSGDDEIKKYPEEFVYYVPPTGYESEFIAYTIANGQTVGEGEPFKGEFFRNFADGSSAAYCTFMGGDYCTAKVTNTGGPTGRKLLIVKDSFGNAMASCLFGSFEEVHVIDFRYYPHNLPKYVRENGITDMVFVNVLSIGMAPTTAQRFRTMLEQE